MLVSPGRRTLERESIVVVTSWNLSLLLAWHGLFAADAQGAGLFGPVWFLPAVLVLGYVLLIRPQQREKRRQIEMLKAIKVTDRVVSIGGIYGVVTKVDHENGEVTVKVDEATNTKLRMKLSAVSLVPGAEPSGQSK